MTSVVNEKHVVFCFNALGNFLEGKPKPEPDFVNGEYPLFVTWHIEKNGERQLRGCIGTFSSLSLHDGLYKYALTSALRDERFDPITLEEFPTLTCTVSLLTNFEEASHYLDWKIGTHGIWINFTQLNGERDTATYLPEVMEEQKWTKEKAILSLLRKGRYRGEVTQDYCEKNIILTRYQSEKIELSYNSIAS